MTDPPNTLTDREREILTLLADGLSNAEIGLRLHLSTTTVKWYNSQIYSKLGVSNRDQAVAFAEREGMLDNPPEIESIPNNIPAQATPFIGRDEQLNALKQMLYERRTRLITLLAAGGMGKTRLAVEVASQIVDEKRGDFVDGVFLIVIQSMSDPQQIVSQIANCIGCQLMGDAHDPKQQLLDYLTERHLLLVMDNCEYLREGVSLVADILQAAPGIRVVATSREKLNLSGETVFSLRGMDAPPWDVLDLAAQYDAVQLFVQMAQQKQPDFPNTTHNLQHVTRICHLTDGMPLAIILAAAWLDTLSIERISDEIQHSLDFLETGMRDIPSRQRSIRAIFDYGWHALPDAEQQVFMTLSIFRGGFTLEAAQDVAGASPRSMQMLVSKALVNRVGLDRYDIHDLLRQYAEQELLASGQMQAVLDRHAQYFARFAHERNAGLKGVLQSDTVRELEADFENLRLMWMRAIGTRNLDIFYQSADTLCWFSHIALKLTEGERLFEAACRSLLPETPDRETAHAWCHLQLRLFWLQMWIYGIPKPFALTLERAERWLDIAQDSGNQTDIAMCYCFVGAIAGLEQHDHPLDALEESLSRFQRLNDGFYAAWALHFLYFHWESRDLQRALTYQLDALTIRRQLAGPYGLSMVLLHVAICEYELGNLEAAEACATEVLSLTPERMRYTWASLVLGDVAFLRGDFEAAREESVAAINAYATNRQHRVRGFSLLKLGMIAAVNGDYEDAMHLYDLALDTNPNPRYMYYLNWLLALAACGMNDYPRAATANRYALASSLTIGAVGRMIWSFPTTALIEVHRGGIPRAVQFLSLAFNHPKSITGWLEKWPLLDELKTRLRTALGADDYERVWDESRRLEATTLVTEYLEGAG